VPAGELKALAQTPSWTKRKERGMVKRKEKGIGKREGTGRA